MIKTEMLLHKFCIKENPSFKEKALLLMRKTVEVISEMQEFDSNELDLMNEV
jgi:hypothetical protein